MSDSWLHSSGYQEAESRCLLQWVKPQRSPVNYPELAWLGHASFSLACPNAFLIVDPVFKSWIGWYRRHVPLPHLDPLHRPNIVLLTHGHMDHLDPATIDRLEPGAIVLPAGSERLLPRRLRALAIPLQPYEEHSVSGLALTSVPALHGGWRYPWQRGLRAYGYIAQVADHCFYFCGDSAYGPHFVDIGRQWKIDTAALPIGAYSPRFFMRSRHMNPAEAWQAAHDLRAGEVVPFHFGAYRLSLESRAEPIQRFAALGDRQTIPWRLPVGLPCNDAG